MFKGGYELRSCPSIEVVKKFFSVNTFENFRYFVSRPYDILVDHHVYYGIFHEGQMIGYGHLDPDQEDKDKNWIGLCISEVHQGKGLGDMLVKSLLSFADSNDLIDIFLSVDKPNYRAKNLYIKNNFKIVMDFNEVFIMKHEGA
jgi:ribosomal protein S18 acetylase RimI-like enzyme